MQGFEAGRAQGSDAAMWVEGGFEAIVGQLALDGSKDGLVGTKGAACRRRQLQPCDCILADYFGT